MPLDEILRFPLLDNPVSDWLIGLGILVAINLAARVVHGVAAARLKPLAERTRSHVDDVLVAVLDRTHAGLVLLVSLWMAGQYVDLPPRLDKGLRVVAIVAAFVQVGRWLGSVLRSVFDGYRQRASVRDAGSATAIRAIGFAAQILMWSLLLLLALDNLGVDVTAMVAGLGIGGIAVALAVQNILGDILASVSIIADRPFVVGDFIIVDEFMGTVEYVGLKTTHVRSLGGEQIVFANSDLLKTRLRNYKRMVERRVVFTFGVRYETSPGQLEWIAQYLRDAIKAEERMRLERAHFFRFGESSLDFEVAYWVKGADYNLYMDLQQALNLDLMKQFASRGIEFAYPTRTVKIDLPTPVVGQHAIDALPDAAAGRRSPGPRPPPHAELRRAGR